MRVVPPHFAHHESFLRHVLLEIRCRGTSLCRAEGPGWSRKGRHRVEPGQRRHRTGVALEVISLLVYALAALAEIAGCFAFWAWLRHGRSALWLAPGVLSLVLFATFLTRIDVGLAGRAYAAYGGIYIATSLLWLWIVEGQPPDRWDGLGAGLCILGAAIILLAHRAPS